MKSMTKLKEIPWLRLTIEGAAIIASILLAFAIDAWWQGRGEEHREQKILVALLDDFERSKANILEGRIFHTEVQQSNQKLLQAVATGENSLTNEEIRRLVGDLGWWDSQSYFSTGALNSLVFGGELSLIKDDELRQLLADWPSQIERAVSLQRQDYDFYLNVWMPFLRANAYLPQWAAIGTPKPGQSEAILAAIDLNLEGSWNSTEMVESREFQNILVQKYWIQYDVLLAFDVLEELIGQTIRRIEGNLQGSAMP
jgi:hypothetical protein